MKPQRMNGLTRRTILQGAAAVFASPLRAAAPAAEPVTDALVMAARKEGKLAFYTAMDLAVAEKLAKAFEAAYAGIAVRVERSGSERVFQRVAQEQASNIHAVDVINSADGAHFIVWKRNGWLAPYLPDEVARFFLGRTDQAQVVRDQPESVARDAMGQDALQV